MAPLDMISLLPKTILSSATVENQAFCYFSKNFILTPCRGNSRRYMDFVVPAMQVEQSIARPRSMLPTFTMAVAYALMGNRNNENELLPKAAKEYSRGLEMMNEALRDPVRALEDDTLASVILLGLFEV